MIRPVLLVLVAVLVLAAAPARAEEWRAPQGAQILVAGRLLPPPPESLRWMERLKGYPIVVAGLEALKKETGVDLEQDVLSWLEGRVLVAQIRMGDYSPMGEMIRQDELQGKYEKVNGEMYTIHFALEAYKAEKGQPPATLEELKAGGQLFDDSVDLSAYRYQRKKDGGWTLEATFPPDSELAAFKPPVFDETGLKESHPPEDPSPSLVVALSVTDPGLARQKVQLLKEKSGLDKEAVPVVELRDGWVIGGDNVQLLDRAAPALSGRAPQNPRLAALLEQVPPDPELTVFVDVPDLLDHWRDLPVQDPNALSTLKAMRGFILTSYATREKVESEAFFALQPPPGHPLAALLEGTGDNRVALAERLPWSISYVDVFEVREMVRAVDHVAELHPMLRMGTSLIRGEAEQKLGLSVDKDLLPASTGEAALNLEVVDIVGGMILTGYKAYTRAREPAVPEEAVPPEPEGSKFAEGPLSEVPGLEGMDDLGEFPFTVVVGLKPGTARQKVLAALDARLGPNAKSIVYGAREIRQAADGRLAYTLRGDDLIVAVGPTLRLMKAMLDGMDGKVPSLASLNSFKDFQSRLRGRLLMFRHSKADAVYSIVKGLLLFLGAEFRAEADRVGLWRDAYAAVTLEPGGVRARGAVYATDQVP